VLPCRGAAAAARAENEFKSSEIFLNESVSHSLKSGTGTFGYRELGDRVDSLTIIRAARIAIR
jgi:hypothetical protein